MKIIMVAVMAVDGKITKWEEIQDVTAWTSTEDKGFFRRMMAKSDLIIMGSGTYEAVKKNLKLDGQKLRIVMTRQPEKYRNQVIKGTLEFSNLSPTQIAEKFSNAGYKNMLIAGGSKIYSLFLREKLIDEIYLTVEPMIFGVGKMLVDMEELNIKLKLQSVRKLNKGGTLLLHYLVDQSTDFRTGP